MKGAINAHVPTSAIPWSSPIFYPVVVRVVPEHSKLGI